MSGDSNTDRSPRLAIVSPTFGAGGQNTEKANLNRNDLNAGLIAAAKLGKALLLEACLEAGADPQAADAKGYTALHWAAFFGHPQVLTVFQRRTDGRGGDKGDAETDGTTLKVRNSPLHCAAERGNLTCLWKLLAMGYSPLDMDACGNTAMHLACACTTASTELQLMMIKTLMHAGFDPDARNWYAQRPVDLLPSAATEARRLLGRAAETTRCAATGVPFGAEELRYLCHCSGSFFSEEASVAVEVRAFPPSLKEIEGVSPVNTSVAHRLARNDMDEEEAGDGDDGPALMPVRVGSDLLYKLSDAETALETALNPFYAATQVNLASTLMRRTARTKRFDEMASPVKAIPEPELAPPPIDLKIQAIAEVEEEEDEEESESEDAESRRSPHRSPLRSLRDIPIVKEEQPMAPARELTPPEREPYLYFSKEHLATLQQCAATVRSMRGDLTLLARYDLFVRKMAAAKSVVAAVSALNASRPLKHRNDGVTLLQAIKDAQVAGLPSDSALLEEARLAFRLAVLETELAACIDVVRTVAVATHANDADVHRIQSAVLEAVALHKQAEDIEAARRVELVIEQAMESPSTIHGSPTQLDKQSERGDRESVARSHAESKTDISAAASKPLTAVRAGVLCPSFVRVDSKLLDVASSLSNRLTCEIGVSDAMDAATRASAAVKSAVAAHGMEDPTLLPTPELTPEEAAAIKTALEAYAAALAAPPPKPKPGTKAPPVPPAPPKPNFPVLRFELDANGVPLPETPQINAILQLRAAAEELNKVTNQAKTSGADAACISSAELILKECLVEAASALEAEKERVALARVERAKLDKKGKKKAKK